jgi:hypothetical protein
MLYASAKIFLVFLLIVPIRAAAQEDVEPQPDAIILSPDPGQAVRGSFPVIVDTQIQEFASAELSFSYEGVHQETWFPIGHSEKPISNAVMTEWDTTLITDGVYRLRLVVVLRNGSQLTSMVSGVRVRNYSAVETDTPTPSATAAPMATPLPTQTPSPSTTPIPIAPTPLPPNPLSYTHQDIGINFLRGAAGGFAFIVIIGLYISARNLFRK